MTTLATTLQLFFSDRLIRQRQVSPNTLQAYRDTLRLLLVFASVLTCRIMLRTRLWALNGQRKNTACQRKCLLAGSQ